MYDILLEYVSNMCEGPIQVIAGAISQTGRRVQVIEPRGAYDAHTYGQETRESECI